MKNSFFFLPTLALTLALALTGCSLQELEPTSQVMTDAVSSDTQTETPTPELPQQQGPLQVNLAYNAADSMNPYEMSSALNRQLIPLLYDSLVRLDKTWSPEPLLAQEVTMDGVVCSIRWRSDARFTDGSYMTGEDIVYSVNTAQNSDTEWKNMLKHVAGVQVTEDESAVEIRLSRPDADFPSLLTFPIIKDGTAEEEYPVGISHFLVAGAHNTGIILKPNPIYYRPESKVEVVRLTHAADEDALQFQLKTGEIDMVYSDMSQAVLSNLSASGTPVSLNNLVYLGINGGQGLLAKPEFRHALSLALNRDEISVTAYSGRVRASRYPFHPDFYRMKEMALSAPRNLTDADALLDGLGLAEKDQDGWRLQNGKQISLRLLVNTENSFRGSVATLVSEQLEQVGIRVELSSKPFSEYQRDLANQQYDLYLGETRLMDNMDFSPLLSGGAIGYATAYSDELLQRYQAYQESGEGIRPLCEMFQAQSPFIPLVFREGMLFVSRDFSSEVVATEQDLFYNILDW